jgi:hypothetical protein
MKRREFLISTAGFAGAALPVVSLGAAKPCPEPTLGIDTGASATTACSSTTAQADWQARITGPGVVWYHGFDTAAEVNAFRWTAGYGSGNDPNAKGDGGTNVSWNNTDGPSGTCLEIIRSAGSNDPAVWWRPFSPLQAPGNGRTTNDPGANPLAYTATDGGGQIAGWSKGVYGPSGDQGTEYWLQFRAKIDPQRAQGINVNIDAGKLTYQTLCEVSNTQQELVTTSFEGSVGVDFFAMYCHSNDYAFLPGMPTNWQWPLGQWSTVMYHVKPGNGGSNTLVEVWVAKTGETSFTQIYSDANCAVSYDSPKGYQALICSIYQNGENMTQFYHRFAQIIFSNQVIACPQV